MADSGGKLRYVGLLVTLAGCNLPSLDLNDRQCPCAPGWICTPLQVCIPENQLTDAGTQLIDSALGVDATFPADSGRADASIDSGSRPDAGTGTDAGRADTGTADVGTPLDDESRCNDRFADALRCNSYNSSLVGGAGFIWTPSDGDSTLELSPDQAYLGSQSLYAQTNESTGEIQVLIQEGWGSSISEDVLYARGYFYFPAVTNPDFISWRLMALQENVFPFNSIEVRVQGNYLPAIFGSVTGNSPASVDVTGATPIPTDQWVCIQLTVEVSPEPSSAQVHINGELAAELNGFRTLPTGGYGHLFSGLRGSVGQPASVYMDEVVVDTSPVPCD